eukprot:15454_1
MISEQQCKLSNYLLFWITVAISISINDGWKCQLYLYSNTYHGGSQFGPFDVGEQYSIGLLSGRLSSAGYYCHVDFYEWSFSGDKYATMDATPFGVSSESVIYYAANTQTCVRISAVATPSPTADPTSASPTSAPSTSPTSSCLDYNNETSTDGNNEM